MKVCIVYHFSRAQGMEHTNAVLIDELQKRGIDVVIATLAKINLVKMFREKFGISLFYSPKIYSILPTKASSLPIFQPFFNWLSMLKCLKHEMPDIIYIDGYYYRVPEYLKRKARVSVYVNEPFPVNEKGKVGQNSELPVYIKVYSKIFDFLLKLITDRNSVDQVICNSRWSARLYESVSSKIPDVVPPPVCTTKFFVGEKENLISCVGVFTPRKKFERTIQALALSKSRPKLAIVGSIVPGGGLYLSYLKLLIKKLRIEERVNFYINSDFDTLRKILSRSKICVSNGIEYFGKAIVEQMASGCIPIVYKYTAPWEDIVVRGKFGFGFETCADLAEIIDYIISDQKLQYEMSILSKNRAKEFDEIIFREKMVKLLLNDK